MKLIDEKGKIFGLVNLIDFFVMLFLLAMIPGFYFGYKIMVKKPIPPFGSDIKEIELISQLIKLRPYVAEMISTTDKELDSEGRVICEIIQLGPIEPYEAEPTLKQRSAKLRLKAQLKGDDIYYKGRAMKYGSELNFKADKYEIVARSEDDITRMLNTRITLKDLDSRTINLITVGDKEIDASGQVIAEVVKLGKPEENLVELDLTNGNFTIGKDSMKKQIPTEIMLRCQIIREGGSNQVYFKGKRLTHYSPIEFVTNKYAVTGFVAKTYEVVPEKKFRWITVKADFKGVMEQIAGALNIGDSEKDFFDSVTAKVVKVLGNKPAEVFIVSEGKATSLYMPSQRDLTIVLDILCEERGDGYYFKNSSIKIGNTIVFSSELYNIIGTIIGVEIK